MASLMTNLMTCASGAVPAPCGVDEPILGPGRGPTVEIFVPEGRAVELVAWSLPTGGTVAVSQVDGLACNAGLTAPYAPCGTPMVISAAQRTVYLGPGRYQLDAMGLLAGFNVKVRNVYDLASLNLRDYQCACPCATPVVPPVVIPAITFTDRPICALMQNGETWNLIERLSSAGVVTYFDPDSSPMANVTAQYASIKNGGRCPCLTCTTALTITAVTCP